ncbi:conserved hypothetical protein [gamma proteobacterium NOR5-3]|nr:conserved hypothetical protein [gamma proteobacterium NOR5-3]
MSDTEQKKPVEVGPAEPASPCISVCALDENDICMGCYRSAQEITDWFMADAAGKTEMLERARARREADSPIRLL